jgi:internalin A
MNDVPRRMLREIVARYGRDVLRDARRCRALLMDFCGEHRAEINLLDMALREEVVRDYEIASARLPRALLVARLANRLQEAYLIPEDAARWAVTACVEALDGEVPERSARVFVSEVPTRVLVRPWLGAADTWDEVGATPGRVVIPDDGEIRICSRPDDRALASLADDLRTFGPVQQLDLSYGTMVGESLEALRYLPGLLRLDLSRTPLTDAGLAALVDHATLLELNLWGCDAITDDGLAALAELTSLEQLELGRCARVTVEGLRHLQGLEHLRVLGLAGTGIDDEGLAALRDLRTLRTLDLSETQVMGEGLAHLAELPGLWSLNLSGCVRLRAAGLRALRRMTALSELNLGRCGLLTDQALVHVRPLRRLTSLSLEGLAVADTGVLYLIDLPALTSLDLAWTGVGDAGVARLGAMRSLRELVLAGSRVTDAGLAQLAALLGLTTLDLSNTAVSDAGLRVLSGVSTLEVLDLEGDHIHDAGLVHLGELPELRRLYLGRTAVTDRGMELLHRLTNIAWVDLTLCRQVTERGIRALEAAGIEVVR